MVKMIKTIVWGAVIVTLIGVELKADTIRIFEVNPIDCKIAGGIGELDICTIDTKNLYKLEQKK
tara:strand:+ start:1774 stop:1965 length:192 start_codon:yes stop_codon:yes gene_type:complete